MGEKRKNKIIWFGFGGSALLICLTIGLGLTWKCQSKPAKKFDDRPTVVCNMGYRWYPDDSFETYYNELLEKYGCRYRVEFRALDTSKLAEYDETYFMKELLSESVDVEDIPDYEKMEPSMYQCFLDLYGEALFKETDIFTLKTDGRYADYFSYYALQGKFLALDDWMETELGQQLYAAYPEGAWENNKVYGETMGIGTMWNEDRHLYLVLNQNYLDKYGIQIGNQTLEEWIEIANEVTAQEKADGNASFTGLVPEYLWTLNNADTLQKWSGVIFVETDGQLEAVSLLDQEDYVDVIRMYAEGEGVNRKIEIGPLRTGNLMGMMIYEYCAERAIAEMQGVASKADQIPWVAVPLEEWTFPFGRAYNYTVISAYTDKAEGAFEVLALSYSIPELSEALAYGVEGKEWFDKVDYVNVVSGSHLSIFGNWMLVRENQTGPANKSEILEEMFAEEKLSPLAGFRFDMTPVREEWDACIRVYHNHEEGLLVGVTEDFDADLAAMRQELEEAGVDRLIAEANRQVQAFLAEKEVAEE